MYDSVVAIAQQYARIDQTMDNSDLLVPDGALPGQLSETLWPDGQPGDDRPLVPLYITRYAGPRALSPHQSHPFWELTYVMRGQGHVDLPDREVFLAAEAGLLRLVACTGNARITPSGIPSGWGSAGTCRINWG